MTLTACAEDDDPVCARGCPDPLVFTAGPDVSDGPPNEAAPLVRAVTLETNRPTLVTANLECDGQEARSIQFDGYTRAHDLTLLGLKPDRSCSVDIIATSGDDTISKTGLGFATDPLPDDFPLFSVEVSDPSRMEPGVVLMEIESGVTVAFDETGDVVWYYVGERAGRDVRRLSNGNLLGWSEHSIAREIDMRGNIVRVWNAALYPAAGTDPAPPEGAIPVATQFFHHEMGEMPNGNFLTLSAELRRIDGYPSSESDPDAPPEDNAPVVGDVIVEFDPVDGSIVNQVSLFDVVDPHRIGYHSVSRGFWDDHFGISTRDWTHANAVIYVPADNAYIVSMRSQDAVISIDRDTHELNWILGTHANWQAPWSDKLLEPVGDLDWQYHQHAITVTPSGFGLFDNGNFRASPPDPGLLPEYSRAVEFSIDQDAMTVEQLWSYGAPTGDQFFYSSALCDADWMPLTGNVLITSGFHPGDTNPLEIDRWASIMEVDPATDELVFNVVVDGFVYRSEKLPDLYP